MHVPVLLNETLEFLNVKERGVVADVTGGGGGHSTEILKRLGEAGRLIILDRDPQAAQELTRRFTDPRVSVFCARFSELIDILEREKISPLTGLIADLGVSSFQLDDPARGFSFQPGPLDMRMDFTQGESAAEIIGRVNEKELADLFFNLGEERHSRKIARAVIHDRQKIKTTEDLARLAERVLGRGRIHPATRIFQALRIAVNEELEELEHLLKALPSLMAPAGRTVLISFHSLEDRRVKTAFKNLKLEGWNVLTKKPLQPGDVECRQNPRSRSAKLRAIEKGN